MQILTADAERGWRTLHREGRRFAAEVSDAMSHLEELVRRHIGPLRIRREGDTGGRDVGLETSERFGPR